MYEGSVGQTNVQTKKYFMKMRGRKDVYIFFVFCTLRPGRPGGGQGTRVRTGVFSSISRHKPGLCDVTSRPAKAAHETCKRDDTESNSGGQMAQVSRKFVLMFKKYIDIKYPRLLEDHENA